MKECVVRNGKGKVVTVAPAELAFRFVKWSCPDDEYSIEGPNINCTVIRKDGVLYPSSGRVSGVHIDPRNLDECKKFYLEKPAVDEDVGE